jgi:hypothetical protein
VPISKICIYTIRFRHDKRREMRPDDALTATSPESWHELATTERPDEPAAAVAPGFLDWVFSQPPSYTRSSECRRLCFCAVSRAPTDLVPGCDCRDGIHHQGHDGHIALSNSSKWATSVNTSRLPSERGLVSPCGRARCYPASPRQFNHPANVEVSRDPWGVSRPFNWAK